MRGGSFRRGLDPLDVHLLISSFRFYRVSNRYTLRAIFGRDLVPLHGASNTAFNGAPGSRLAMAISMVVRQGR